MNVLSTELSSVELDGERGNGDKLGGGGELRQQWRGGYRHGMTKQGEGKEAEAHRGAQGRPGEKLRSRSVVDRRRRGSVAGALAESIQSMSFSPARAGPSSRGSRGRASP
jgi:hypothetical protein